MSKSLPSRKAASPDATVEYAGLLGSLSELLELSRRTSARAVNSLMTATYWELGRRIVEFEQGGKKRAAYGGELIDRLSVDLTERFGRGFSPRNLLLMRRFYSAFPVSGIPQTASAELHSDTPSGGSSVLSPTQIPQTLSAELCNSLMGFPNKEIGPTGKSLGRHQVTLSVVARALPLPWSHYVLLIGRTRSAEALAFYHAEALRGGWSSRQLQRQIDSQFYERNALSRNKAAMLSKAAKPQPGDVMSAEEEIKHPLVLEFLGLRDEYSESDMEEALIRHLESFLLELGNDFAFVGRQRRLRIDDEWYRVDLLFFHRRLRSLVIVDLKLGRFTHADAGQMHLFLNYAREHWVQPGENPPVGIILCSSKGESLVRYATDSLPNKLLVREYLTALPDEKVLAAELEKTRATLESRRQ